MISNKNFFGAAEIMDGLRLSDDRKEQLLRIGSLFGSIDKLLSAVGEVKNERSLAAVERLESIYSIVKEKGYGDFITFDLGVLSKYHYYTGMVVNAYTYGTGDAIIKGGRYDNLLSEFGKQAPATGFAIVVDRLLGVLKDFT